MGRGRGEVMERGCGILTHACLRHCACVVLDCVYKWMFCIISCSLPVNAPLGIVVAVSLVVSVG